MKNSSDITTVYLRQINEIPLMTAEQEYKTAMKALRGDNAAKQKLITTNLRFVVNVAKQYQNRGLSLMDLISEGNIGLMVAAERFDPTKGYKFISYAVWWIKQAILKAISEKSRLIRLPLNRANELQHIKDAKKLMDGAKTENEQIEEISHLLHLDSATIKNILDAARPAVSFEQKAFDDSSVSVGDYIRDDKNIEPERFTEHSALRDEIEKALSKLDQRDAEVLRYRYGLSGRPQLSLREVGHIFELTKERIRQIEKRALHRLSTPQTKQAFAAYVA